MQVINGMNITQRRPGHPGSLLRVEMEANGLTPGSLAGAIRVSRQQVSALVNERARITPNLAARIGRYFGTSPEMWLNAQARLDLWELYNDRPEVLEQIQPLNTASFPAC